MQEAAELAGIQVLRITSKTSALTLTTFLRRQPFIGGSQGGASARVARTQALPGAHAARP